MKDKNPNNPQWQRIEDAMRIAGERNPNAFARRIGLKRAENLYQIKRGNNRISYELAEMIHLAIPQISAAWLMTGEYTGTDISFSQREQLIITKFLARDYRLIEEQDFVLVYIKR